MKLRTLIAAGLLACALTVHTAAATVTVGGTTLPASTHTFVVNGCTYVPLRAVAQLLDPDAAVSWSSGTASVTSDVLNLTARPGEKWIVANGRYFYLPDGVKNVNGRLYVHIRVLAAAMGGAVRWDASTGNITVTRGSGAPAAPTYSDRDVYWLSRIISAESQGEPLLGKLAVGTVVLNRVASSQFPNTVYDVIFDKKWGVQFTPVANGTVYNTPTAESVIAARLCLEGARAAGSALYFLDPSQSSNFWVVHNRPYITTIGCHQFYA